jgi:uncharacterized protein (TIGR02996 family)
MSHEAAFLETIADDPDNDALRLIFADYLDERDDPRIASPLLEALDLGANDYSDEAAALKAACQESGEVEVSIDRPIPHRQLL